MPRRFASEVTCSIRSGMTRTPFPAAGSGRWRGRNGSERTSSSGPPLRNVHAGVVVRSGRGRYRVPRAQRDIRWASFLDGERGGETGETRPPPHLQEKGALMTRVSISPNLAELPTGGPETASSGSFPPRSPETYFYFHPTLSADDQHGES